MISEIEYLLTMDKPPSDVGKIIIYQRKGQFETHCLFFSEDQEEVDIRYIGPHLDKAWETAVLIRDELSKKGFKDPSPPSNLSLSAIPPSYLFLRKLECFSSKHMNTPLFLELKKWRKNMASSFNIPPYFIGTDKLLSLIATFIPKKEEELLQIPGIGRQKMEQYGPKILDLTEKYPQIYPFPLSWVHEQVSVTELSAWLLDDKLLREEKREARMKQEKEEKLRLLEAIQDQVPIEAPAERLALPIAQIMKRLRDLAKDGYEVLAYLENEVSRLQEKEMIQDLAIAMGATRLKPIFEKMYGSGTELPAKEKGEKYNQIRLVCTYLQLKSAS